MGKDLDKGPEKLMKACKEAFENHPTSCSHAVWYVIKQYKSEQQWMSANDLVEHIDRSLDWKEVDIGELSELANNGVLVVGGATENEHGHVVVVYPGKSQDSGGFRYVKKGKEETARSYGKYALAMSTSQGSWPGAKSNGDKTVFDAWGATKFKAVRFWKYVGPQTDTVSLTTRKRRIKTTSLYLKQKQISKLKLNAIGKGRWKIKSFTDCFNTMNRKWQKVLSTR